MSYSDRNMCVDKIIQGGGVAAPIASQVLGEVLPYLELEKDQLENINMEKVEMPNVVGKTLQEAKQILSECGLNANIIKNEEENEEEVIIKEQIPIPGVNILKDTEVIIKH